MPDDSADPSNRTDLSNLDNRPTVSIASDCFESLRAAATKAEWLQEDVHVFREVGVVVRDGVTLMADIYVAGPARKLPDGPVPVLIERTPYDRKAARFSTFAIAAAKAGYAFVIQDVRGRGDSG